MPALDPYHVPLRLRARFDEIVALTGRVATECLDAEYAELCRRMAAVLARKRPSPLERGQARTWAAGILHAVGWVNFLTDPSQRPHMTTAALATAAGVGQSTMAATFRTIRDLLDLMPLDPDWTRPSKLLDNPLAWMILVDGIPLDARKAPREVQEELFRRGIIPFVPGMGAGAVPSVAGEAMAEAEELLQRTLAEHPDATPDELNAALGLVTARYNRRAHAELGGLSPASARRLLDADWQGTDSAIRLDETLTLEELASSRTLQDARLVLAMLAERGEVRATPKGNLPRAFVDAFGAQRPAATDEELPGERRVRNEEDLFFPLHLPRVLLEVAGLVKRRKGIFALTRRGGQLAAALRAGELFAILVRTHFRRLDLAYLDGAAHAPAFQHGIGYTFYQFGRHGAEWRTPGELTEMLVLPGIRDEISFDARYDVLALILETRFLRPLAGFGLAEARKAAQRPGDLIGRTEYRVSPLFQRAVRFHVEPEDGNDRAAR